MENQHQQQQQNSLLCRGGCGFFGAAATDGLCSKCHKDLVGQKQDATRISPPISDVPMLSSMAERAVCESINSSSTRSCSHSPSSQQPLSCSQEAFSSEEVAAAFESAAAANGGTTTLLSSSSTASLDIPSVQLSDSSSPDSPSSSLSTSAPPLKKSNRCQHCKKRVGLTGFSCRCGGLFCSEHRYDTAHSCSFDYKTMEREELRKNNPMIVSDKIQRI